MSDDVEKAELSKARPLPIKREQLRSGFKMPQAYRPIPSWDVIEMSAAVMEMSLSVVGNRIN